MQREPDAPRIAPTRRSYGLMNRLFDRGFNWVVASEAFVDIGVLARVAAQSWVAYDLTGSSLWVGTVAAFRAIPSFLSPAIAAYIGNHVDHRILIAAMRSFIGVLAIIQAILIGTGHMRPWHQVVLTLLTGLAIAVVIPSFQTFLVDLVHPGMARRANGFLAFFHNIGELIGPVCVGIIIALAGADWAFVFVAILYFGGALLIMNVPLPSQDSQVGNYYRAYLTTLRVGIRNVRSTKPLPWLFAILFVTNIFGVAVFPLIPEYAIEVFDSGGLGFGLMTGLLGGGLAIGSVIVAMTGLRRWTSLAVLLTSLVWAAGCVGFAFSPELTLSLAILFVMGIASIIWANAILLMIRAHLPNHFGDQVISIHAIGMSMIPIGWAVGGAIATLAGNEMALIIAAVASAAVPVIAYIGSTEFRC